MNKNNLKKIIKSLIVVAVIISIFALIDYYIHSLNIEYAVPQRYFTNKMIYGVILGAIALLVFQKQKTFLKALLCSLIVSIFLQIRYFLEGYPLDFVLLFLLIHFLILLIVSFLIFKISDKKNKQI